MKNNDDEFTNNSFPSFDLHSDDTELDIKLLKYRFLGLFDPPPNGVVKVIDDGKDS